MQKLHEDEIRTRMDELESWTLNADTIRRQYTFRDFADALTFVLRLGFEAESADHHPAIRVDYKRVTLTYSTHSAGGLTGKDFEGAKRADQLALRMGGT
jgi:4a-hydroxytetrahydrobiopterin dehydratase